MSTLSNYATASASNKEDRIYKIFAYLNTRNEFQPIEMKRLSSVSDDTIYGYLKTIQNAQMANDHYQKHLEDGFETKKYANTHIQSQNEHAKKQYDEWLKRLEKSKHYSDERKEQLKQFEFTGHRFLSYTQFYERLEHSLLIYSLLSKKLNPFNS